MKMSKIVEEIRRNAEAVGQVYDVLEAADGEILDGNTRLGADPSWSRKRLPKVKTKIQKLAVRYAVHIRRKMSAKEKGEIMDGIAKELIRLGLAKPQFTKQIKKEFRDRPVVIPMVAEILGITEHTVCLYISDRYKRGRNPEKLTKTKTELPAVSSYSPAVLPAAVEIEKPEKRSRLEIKIDILEFLKNSPSGISPTRVMYTSNISWNVLQDLLHSLFVKGLITVSTDKFANTDPSHIPDWAKYHKYSTERRYYFITDLGIEILRRFREIEAFLSDIEIQTPSLKR